MPPLPELVRRRWPNLRGPGIAAVSGGADSVALLRILASCVDPLVVAHLNHQLRGDDSNADEQFVRDLAQSLGIACKTIAIDVGAAAKQTGANLEDLARRTRYDWLMQVAAEFNATWIATGHTADDQAETMLHRLLRGTGIQGLRGIARERPLRPGLRLVRPLLDAARADIVDYLHSLNQRWREDLTNADVGFTRNRIRHELLPVLRSYNPAIVDVLGRLSAQANEIFDEEEAAAQRLLQEAELPAAGPLRIFRADALRLASPHRVRGMFRLLWERERWSRNDMTFEHWKRLVDVALGASEAIDLPGRIRARMVGSVVQVGKV